MSSPLTGKDRPACGGMSDAPIGEQAALPLTVAIGLVIWMRYCCFLSIGIGYLLQRPGAPIVPQASPSRCILKAKRESARRDAWTWPTCEATLPFIGYIGPWQPAHQKVASSGRRAVAAMQSPAHAACATGLEKTTASGLMSAVSVSSCHRGSTSVI